MSFSSDVKDELNNIIGQARHCQLAELASIVHFAGRIGKSTAGFDIPVENEYASRKYFTLLQKTFNINSVDINVFQALKIAVGEDGSVLNDGPVDGRLLLKDCCRRAFLRGAFLVSGSLSDPSKGYHLEFVCRNDVQAGQLRSVMADFGLESHSVLRKNHVIVYIKEGEAIVDLLNIMGAHTSLMNLENTRILKEISNTINRRVNCEAANIAKTISAASKQSEDIEYIRDHHGLDSLPDRLKEMAQVRLENPEASLKELGELLDPPVGKSGVNHRLRQLSEFAESLRQG
ncbi:hypothetical protein SAMN02910292_01290 [Lachnospiraceae bacterium XBB2008]|nr:hypothetical protein SAMN02910292_01290 [Lachnospiraceae bacterium XBB2008]